MYTTFLAILQSYKRLLHGIYCSRILALTEISDMAFRLFVWICLAYTAKAELIDMTHTFNNKTLHWPGGQADFHLRMVKFGMQPAGYWVQTEDIESGIHVGTHMDAPKHITRDNWGVDDIPIDRLVARSVAVIDIRQKAALSPDVNVTFNDVSRYESQFGEIPRGAVVIMCSGWDAKFGDEAAYLGNDIRNTSDYHFPGFGVDSVEWLINERGIVGLGVDTMSIDYGQSRTIPAHRMFTSHNLFGLENVKNVCLLPPAGATIYAFPTKIEGASGAHVRVIGSWDTSATDIMLSSRVLLTCGLILYKFGL